MNPALATRVQGHQLSLEGQCRAWAGTVEGQDKQATKGQGPGMETTWPGSQLSWVLAPCFASPGLDQASDVCWLLGQDCPLEPRGNPLGVPQDSPSSMQVTGPEHV